MGDYQARYKRGMQLLKKMGREELMLEQKALCPDMYDISVGHLFGDIWARPGLSLRDRQLVTLAANIALARSTGNYSHYRSAQHIGITYLPISSVPMRHRTIFVPARQEMHTSIFWKRIIKGNPHANYLCSFRNIKIRVVLVPRLLSSKSWWLKQRHILEHLPRWAADVHVVIGPAYCVRRRNGDVEASPSYVSGDRALHGCSLQPD